MTPQEIEEMLQAARECGIGPAHIRRAKEEYLNALATPSRIVWLIEELRRTV